MNSGADHGSLWQFVQSRSLPLHPVLHQIQLRVWQLLAAQLFGLHGSDPPFWWLWLSTVEFLFFVLVCLLQSHRRKPEAAAFWSFLQILFNETVVHFMGGCKATNLRNRFGLWMNLLVWFDLWFGSWFSPNLNCICQVCAYPYFHTCWDSWIWSKHLASPINILSLPTAASQVTPNSQ